MDAAELKVIAERSRGGLSSADDLALRGWIDHAFGTDEVTVVVGALSSGVPELALSVVSYGVELIFSAQLRLRASGQRIGWMVRRIALDAGVAIHTGMRLDAAHQGKGYGTALLAAAVRTYDALGIVDVTLRAGFELGRWHWARVGFEFALEHDQALVIAHAQRVVQQLALDVLVSETSSAREIAQLMCSRRVTLREVAAASGPFDARRMLDLARGGFDLDAALPLGQAILLCGPEWSGSLRLRGPARAVFDRYVRERCETDER